jgi:methyl-accepting chemotaxis protein
MAVAQATDLQEKIVDMSGGLASTSQQLSAVIESLATGSGELASSAQNIALEAKEIQKNIDNTDQDYLY